jgi:hypothetical protein
MRLLNLLTIITLTTLPCGASTTHRHRSQPKVNVTLQPSHDSLLRQNACVDQLGLQRLQDEAELEELVMLGRLVALPETDAVRIAPSLPANRRYALPQTVGFLLTLADAYRKKFGQALTVDSAVRPITTQEHLRRINKSATTATGETASSHEAGTTIDLSRRMSRAQTRWMESMLSVYQAMNVVVVEEERGCFHVMVIGDVE